MLWELAGLKDLAPAAEKGFSMLTAALQKRISIHKKAEKKRNASAKTQRHLEKQIATRKSAAKRIKAKKKRG